MKYLQIGVFYIVDYHCITKTCLRCLRCLRQIWLPYFFL